MHGAGLLLIGRGHNQGMVDRKKQDDRNVDLYVVLRVHR